MYNLSYFEVNENEYFRNRELKKRKNNIEEVIKIFVWFFKIRNFHNESLS